MHSTLRLNEADLQRDAKSAPLPPENLTNAEELLAKLAQGAASATTNRPAGTAEADFSAGARLAALSPDIAPRPLGNEQVTGELRSRGRRVMPGALRLLLAACIGVVATLAWQSYGAAGRRMVANFVSQLGLASPPDMTQPVPGAVNKDSAGAAVEANAAEGAPAQVAAPAQSTPDPVVTPAPALAEVSQQIEALARDIAAMRQSMEQLTAAQSRMAGGVAALQAAEDARREPPASSLRPAARKPTRPPPQHAPQSLPSGSRPPSQSVATSPPSAPAPLPVQPQPPRPPGSMP